MKCIILILALMSLPTYGKSIQVMDQKIAFHNLFGIWPSMPIILVNQKTLTKLFDKTLGRTRYAYGQCRDTFIKINQTFWKTATRIQRRELIWHEWGHCYLGLGHPDDPWEYTIMGRVMNVTRPDGLNWDELTTELYWRWLKGGRK